MATPESGPIAVFYKVAMSLLDEVRSLLRFDDGSGPEWDDLRCNQMPHDLRIIRAERGRACEGLSMLRYELQEAREFHHWYGERADQVQEVQIKAPDTLAAFCTGLIRQMEEALPTAENRSSRAIAADQSIDLEWRAAEKRLADAWRIEHRDRLVGLLRRFRGELEHHQHKLGGLVELPEQALGDLAKAASSASQVLTEFAQLLLDRRHYTVKGPELLTLRLTLEKEIGLLARSEPPQERAAISEPASSSAIHHPCFFRDGDGWTVQFGGHRAIIKDSKGMSYLQRLLSQPGTPIAATDLGGLDPSRKQGGQVRIDREMAGEMKRRLLEIDNELEAPQGRPRGDLLQEERDDLAREKEMILAEASKAKSLDRARVMKSEQGSVQGSVKAAIRRAIAVLKERHEPIWNHLESFLIDPYGTAPCYRPSPSITWMVNQ